MRFAQASLPGACLLAVMGGCGAKPPSPAREAPSPKASDLAQPSTRVQATGELAEAVPGEAEVGRARPRAVLGCTGPMGLAWLAANQEPDGRWSSARHEGAEGHDGLDTGLAVLAFSARGQSERVGPYRETIARAM